jgi:hypothetical protein
MLEVADVPAELLVEADDDVPVPAVDDAAPVLPWLPDDPELQPASIRASATAAAATMPGRLPRLLRPGPAGAFNITCPYSGPGTPDKFSQCRKSSGNLAGT